MQGAILTYMSASYMLNGPSLGIVIGYEFSSLALLMNVRQWKAARGVGVFAVSPVPSFLFGESCWRPLFTFSSLSPSFRR